MHLTTRLTQSNPTIGDIDGNTTAVLDALSRARRDDVDLAVFSETVVTGYGILDPVGDDAFVDANRGALDRIAAATEPDEVSVNVAVGVGAIPVGAAPASESAGPTDPSGAPESFDAADPSDASEAAGPPDTTLPSESARAAAPRESLGPRDAPDAGETSPPLEAIEPKRREKDLHEALVLDPRDRVERAGFETVIVSVSGDVDSSLALAIRVDAVGPGRVVAYNLPSSVNSETTGSVAARVAENLGVDYRVLPVRSVADEVLSTYESHVGRVERDVSRENAYARVRGLLVMFASNDAPPGDPALLVSNGNETGVASGRVTLSGDTSGGLDLLGDRSKTDVYDPAASANERHGREVIPAETFDIAPSAELSTGREDTFDVQARAVLADHRRERAGARPRLPRTDRQRLGRRRGPVRRVRRGRRDRRHRRGGRPR